MGMLSFIYRQIFVVPEDVAADIALSGQTALVTGSNTGIGLDACSKLLDHKISHLILGVRSNAKGQDARTKLLASHPGTNATIDVWDLDMDDPKSVVAFAKRADELHSLTVAILNAGAYLIERVPSPVTGVETNVQVNYLSTALLATLLLPTLRKAEDTFSRPSHLTITTSEMHMWSRFPERKADKILTRLNEPSAFNKADRYGTSKCLGVLYFRELAEKVPSEKVIINMVNPGLCKSELHRSFSGLDKHVIGGMRKLCARTTEVGARTLIYGALEAGEESHGTYLTENHIASPASWITTPEGNTIQEKLWKETCEVLSKETDIFMAAIEK